MSYKLRRFFYKAIDFLKSTFLSDKPGQGIDKQNAVHNSMKSRREILSFGASAIAFLGMTGPATAFSNKISDKYDDRPKRKGPQVCARLNSVMRWMDLFWWKSCRSFPSSHWNTFFVCSPRILELRRAKIWSVMNTVVLKIVDLHLIVFALLTL